MANPQISSSHLRGQIWLAWLVCLLSAFAQTLNAATVAAPADSTLSLTITLPPTITADVYGGAYYTGGSYGGQSTSFGTWTVATPATNDIWIPEGTTALRVVFFDMGTYQQLEYEFTLTDFSGATGGTFAISHIEGTPAPEVLQDSSYNDTQWLICLVAMLFGALLASAATRHLRI